MREGVAIMSPDSDSPHHGRNQSIALLGIGTALIGFGLFAVELRGLAETVALFGKWQGLLWQAASVSFIAVAGYLYLRLVGSVHELLARGAVSGEDVARGPMRHLLFLAVAVMASFIFNLQ